MNRKKSLIVTGLVLLTMFLSSALVMPTYAWIGKPWKTSPPEGGDSSSWMLWPSLGGFFRFFREKLEEGVMSIDFTFDNEWGTYEATAYYSKLTRASENGLPTVVFAHGFGANKDLYMWIAEALAQSGFVAVMFTVPGVMGGGNIMSRFAGFGGMGGFLGGNGLGGFLDAEKWSDGISDCISEIEDRDIVDPNRIGVMGHSMGGLGAIMAASKDPRIKCVVGLAPAIIKIEEMSGMFGMLSRFGMFKNFMESTLPVPEPDTITVPIQIQLGTAGENGGGDGFVPYEGVYAFYEGLGCEKEFVPIPGGNHVQFMDDNQLMKVAMRLDNEPTISTEDFHSLSNNEFIDWFKKHL